MWVSSDSSSLQVPARHGAIGPDAHRRRRPPAAELPRPPPPDPKKPHKLEITTPTKARYKVTEQLAGISFPSEAVGTTEAITGAIIVNPDGTIAPDIEDSPSI